MDGQDLAVKVEFVKMEDNPFLAINPEENKFDMEGEFPVKKLKKSSKTGEERRPRKPLQPGMRVGHWTPEEKKKYHWFLELYHSHFENKHLRRMDKIFKTMADFLGSRAADQCRSHHQKMQKKYKNFYNIIFNLRNFHYNCVETDELCAQMTSYYVSPPENIIPRNVLLERLEQLEVKQQPMDEEPQTMLLKIESPRFRSQPNFYSEINHMEEPLQFFSGTDLLSSEHLI